MKQKVIRHQVNINYLYLQKITDIMDFTDIYVKNHFDCSDNKLKNLIGGPKRMYGSYYCDNNLLESLKGSPQVVPGTFYCNNNLLTDLRGCPKDVKNGIICSANFRLTSLQGIPDYVNFVYCDSCNLKNFIGAPKHIEGTFMCNDNPLESLEGFPKYIGRTLIISGGTFSEKEIRNVSNIDGSIQFI